MVATAGGSTGSDVATQTTVSGSTSTSSAGGVVSTTGTSTTSGTGTTTSDSGSSSVSADDGGVCDPAATVTTYPTLPGAVVSPLYTVSANGTSVFVEKLTKFAPEMQVHYAHFSLGSGCTTATVAVTVSQSFSSYTLSPQSRNIAATKSGNTITFSSGPNYLVLQFDSQELLFVLIDAAESNPPQLGDADVKNIMDYSVDNTGATLMTSQIQSAINAASGATQNILYFPPGKYLTGELYLKSNMTMYLAGGSVLYGTNNVQDYTGGGLIVEQCADGLIHMLNISNTKLLGRGVIDGNGSVIRVQYPEDGSSTLWKVNGIKIDQSSNILIDGIVSRDSGFWNTIIYKSNMVTIQNYKVINQRPTTTTFNQTDGVDFDSSTNGKLYNAFLYTGDDNMATKAELDAGMDTNGIVHQHVVTYSNSAGCTIGTKTGGMTMQGIVFDDIDIVHSGRAMAIDAYDTAVVEGTQFEDIRVEEADSELIDIEENNPPNWRPAANVSVTDNTTYSNVTSLVNKTVNLTGKSSTININGVHFDTLTVQGQHVTAPTSVWTEQDVQNVTFQ